MRRWFCHPILTVALCVSLNLPVCVLAQSTPVATLAASCTRPCNAPATVTLSATTTVASGRTVSKVEFYDGAIKLATDTSSPYSTTVTSVAGGSHSYAAKAYDNAATPLVGTSAAKVIAVNTAPTVTLTAVCGASPCNAPATVNLTAVPADSDGAVAKVQFYRGTTLLSTKTAAPWTFSDTALSAGTYSYTAKATDNGATPLVTTSTAQSVTVVVPTTPPSVSLSAACAAPCNAPASVAMSATATAASGRSIQKVEFYDGATLLATDTTAPYSFTKTGVTGGAHSFTAKAYDNAATPLSATSVAQAVVVNTAPTVSISATCSSSPCSAPATISLSATASDSGGSVSKVEFYRGGTLLATKTAPPWTHSDSVSTGGTFSYTARAYDSAATPLNTTSSASSVVVAAATATTYNMVIDGLDVAVNLPGTLPPQFKFSARAGDRLILRVVSQSADYITGYFVLPADFVPLSQNPPAATDKAVYWVDQPNGVLGLLVRADGDYTIKFSHYGTGAQSLVASLLRLPAPVVVSTNATSTSASNDRAGRPLVFEYNAQFATQFSCALRDDPGWTDAAGVPISSNPLYLAGTVIISPSQTLVTPNGAGDCFSGDVDFVPADQLGTYTMVVTPIRAYLGKRSLTLYAPNSVVPVQLDSAPLSWAGSGTADGARISVPVVVGRRYSVVVAKENTADSATTLSMYVDGAPSGSYPSYVGSESYLRLNPDWPALQTKSAGKADFVADRTGTAHISLLRISAGPPIRVSVAEEFQPVASFLDPAAVKLYDGYPYYNGVSLSGTGKIAVQAAYVTMMRQGWTDANGTNVAASIAGVNDSPFQFRIEAAAIDFVRKIYGQQPRSIYALVTFVNGVSVVTPVLGLLDYQVPSGVVLDTTSLQNGMTVDDDQISFAGVVTTGDRNTSVMLGDSAYAVGGGSVVDIQQGGVSSRGGEFAINNYPLLAGANNIAVKVQTLDGTQTYSYVVNRAAVVGPKRYAIDFTVDRGDAPLSSTIRIRNLLAEPWQQVQIQFGGISPPVIVPATSAAEVTYSFIAQTASDTLTTGGVLPVYVSVFGQDGRRLYRTTRYVSLTREIEKAGAARSAFAFFKSRTGAANASAAAAALSDSALPKFQPLLQALGPNITSLATIGDAVSWAVYGGTVELTVQRGLKLFPVFLVRDPVDGLWRIQDM